MDLFVDAIVTLLNEGLRGAGAAPEEEVAGAMIETPPDPELGDYAFPCFSLAKVMRKAPPAIAAELAEKLDGELSRPRDLLNQIEQIVNEIGGFAGTRSSASILTDFVQKTRRELNAQEHTSSNARKILSLIDQIMQPTTAPDSFKPRAKKYSGIVGIPVEFADKPKKRKRKLVPKESLEAIKAREILDRIRKAVEAIRTDIIGVEAAGPYLNFRVSPEAMAEITLRGVLDGSYFLTAGTAGRDAGRKKVMVEYSQPNTHKAFHVGHMRNVALGDALLRIMEYAGHEVVAANYIGDIGTHIAKCLWFYMKHREEEPPAEGSASARGEWLGTMYTAAEAMLRKADKAAREGYDREIREVLQALESGKGEVYDLWRETRAWSLAAFEEIYAWLGARFDVVFYESDMELGRRIVEEGLQGGVFQRSQGAVGIDLEPHKLGFFLVLKADGTTLYSTKDLALAQIKFRDHGIQESIYVVGAEQKLHFQQVFKTLELLGYEQAADCHHLPYGLVMLPEGKMSSRAGNVILFSRLREELNAYIEAHYMRGYRGEWSGEEIAETTRRIAVAAIRYGMIKQDAAKSIVFNLEDWLVSEGDTGTYLCYAYTRINSVLRKVGRTPDIDADYGLLTQVTERRLVRELYDFNRAATSAADQLRPNLVANALFQIAKEFSRAYATSPVKQAEDPALGNARLALFKATGIVLKQGLALLGITPPERM